MSKASEEFQKAYSEPLLATARPCPFCKGITLGLFPGPPSPIIPGDTVRVACPRCLGQGPIGESAQRAVAKWNGDFEPMHQRDLPV